jgi:hypothetical protein
LEHVLGYVKKHKEVRSSDFKRTDGKKGAWWNWKAEKIALEVLFDEGELMIARRDKFRRVYTVRQRILPRWDDKDTPIYAETQKALAAKALKALGVATAPWIADYFYLPQREINGIMKILVEKGIALHVEVDDWGECFIHKDNVCLNESVKNATHTTLLSPFDPLINNRKRALSVFKFDYKIECYTPAAKRKYGYFTLPILWRGNLIGRLDPKAHRKDGVFEIKNIVFEDGIKITGELMADMAKAVQDCANWHGTPEVKVVKSTPKEVKNTLGNYL